MRVSSELTTLGAIVDRGLLFRVPIYQRLYVWCREQIDTLLSDLWAAFTDDVPVFYLGGTLVIERPGGEEVYLELVDGQQRFTTLWMMSLAWGGALAPFRFGRSDADPIPRLRFDIRPDVDTYFRDPHSDAQLSHAPIVDAMARIRAFLDAADRRPRALEFQRFVSERVQLVLTRVPPETDLNKLYEVINSRGQQLLHHEILKARLLGLLPAEERHGYAQLWEACSDMGAYVERALKGVSGLKIRALVATAEGQTGDALRSAKALLARLSARETEDGSALDLAAILDDPADARRRQSEQIPDEIAEAADVRSILSFPMLLQHTLRLWLYRRSLPDLERIADRELLALFDARFLPTARAAEVQSFVELLWELRYVFDEHVVKWVREGDEERLLRARVRVKAARAGHQARIHREPLGETDAYTLLQAMLYHSQQITTHYWLTPFLAYLWRHRPDAPAALAYLRHLDNHLHCRSKPGTLVEMSREFLGDAPTRWHRAPLGCSMLDEPLGVGFPHYWFYKLEFLLWDRRRGDFEESRVRAFRITARNSVEHISPQTPKVEDTNRVSPEVLDTFGNLALVSRTLNSEYGNLPFNEKRARFWNRNAVRLDSLKMAFVYRNEVWNDALAQAHQVEMTELLRAYIGEDFAREGV